MKRLLLFLGLLGSVILPCQATFTRVQLACDVSGAACGTSSGTSCTVDNTSTCGALSSTGSGNLLMAVVQLATSTSTVSGISGGGTWTRATGCNAGVAVFNDCWYVLSSTSGVTSITATVTSNKGRGIFIYEYSFTGGSVSLDTTAEALPAGCTACQGPSVGSVTLTGTNDVIIAAQIGNGGAAVNSLTGTGWTLDISAGGGKGVGTKENVSSYTRPTFNMAVSQSVDCVSIFAMMENPAVASPGLLLRGVGN